MQKNLPVIFVLFYETLLTEDVLSPPLRKQMAEVNNKLIVDQADKHI
jgi:hypothetical protein